jgi:energy-coupling factor transporter transmembrane protein EcfT
MSRLVWIVVGVVLTAAGVLFTLQGLNVIGGSGMSGKSLWVVLGPIIAIIGLAILVRGGRNRSTHDDLV